jgi:DNA polymerase-3 subunit epsilon/ATP-dependent DNA helicase DinG
MAKRSFVALDLETTGLDARVDAIIEVGAVRFAFDPGGGPFGCQVLERFVTFVNPRRAIPLRITQLTGIRDADVASAPTFDRVIPELLAFVGPDVEAVLAHNASFDFSFLQAANISFHRPTQDTFELAAMLLPGRASYSLGELTRSLQIPLSEAHRALDDAEATAHLFTYLMQRLAELPGWLCTTLAVCGNGTGWPPLELLPPLLDREQRLPPPPVTVPIRDASWSPVAQSLLDDTSGPLQTAAAARLEEAFAPGGILHQLYGDAFEQRQGQIDMAQRVLQALNTGDHLIIEAGTGTGKSIAYLLPAALWSLANQRRVVVATNTIALQEQLLEKDIPVARNICAALGLPRPTAALLKGRNNYLCTRRLYRWYDSRALSMVELRVLAKVLVWLCTTTTGDVTEIFLPSPAERLIWNRLCSDSASCTFERCAAADGQYNDFFFRARVKADAAHLLIINHALLFADIAAEGRILPPYSHLIVDEAHHLEEAATDQLSYRVDWSMAAVLLQRLQAAGDLYRTTHQFAVMQDDLGATEKCYRLATAAGAASQALRSFAAALLSFARSREGIRHDFSYAQRFGLDSHVRTQPAWSEIEILWDQAGQALRVSNRRLAGLVQHLEERNWWLAEATATLLQELQSTADQLETLLAWLDEIILQPAPTPGGDFVTWLEVNESVSEAILVAAPLFVNETVEKALVHGKRSVVFTGATLRTGSGFSFIRDRLGLWDVTASTVDSPFDYKSSTLLYVPSDLPEPNHSHYQPAVEQAIIRAAVAAGGSTLALFTNYAQLRATAEAIRAPLDRLGITVLQHGTSSRRRLLREYRQAEKAVLLGTRSFWEGIDLPGDELRCLLIVRLPFAVPSDPLVAARSAELENPFRDYTLPDAIIRFRQGFGRLIRRATDCGVVVVLDSRIWRKEYGQSFLESIPECTTRHAPLANLEDEIVRWLRQEERTTRVRG